MNSGPQHPRKTPRRNWLACLLLLELACSGGNEEEAAPVPRGEPVVKTVKDGDVVFVARVFGKELAFGERLEAELEFRSPAGVTVRDLTLRSYAGHLLVRERRVVLDETEDGTRTQRLVCQLEARASGTQLIAFPPLTYREATTQEDDERRPWKTLQLPAFPIEVSAPEADARPTLEDLNGPGDPLELPVERRLPRFLPYALALLASLALLAWFLVRRARRRKNVEPEPRDPRDLAREELDALLARGLVERSEFATFYYELTRIVREYVERTTGVRAPELTTEEFLRACEKRDDVELFRGESRSRLRRFLESADLIKYAAQIPGAEAIEESVEAARAFCGLAERKKQEALA